MGPELMASRFVVYAGVERLDQVRGLVDALCEGGGGRVAALFYLERQGGCFVRPPAVEQLLVSF
jgi:hypothetical protein